jgi:uncharacterized GH25 family protein
MKRTMLLLAILVSSLFIQAHEFWLQPQKFFYSIREVANIRFLVGEHFTGTNWAGSKDNVAQLFLFTPSGIDNLLPRISSGKGDSLQVPLQEEGTHMVIFNSTNSFIKLEAAAFNDYLQEDGLETILLYRKEHDEVSTAGREYYQRSVKTIFQVGSKITDDCTGVTSLPLDIVPEENPYALPVYSSRLGLAKVRFRILFNGEPLNNALVKIWHRSSPKQFRMDTVRTNKRGWVTANRYPGPYLVSCVYMEPNTKDFVANWQSYWSSLSFEYSQYFPKAG